MICYKKKNNVKNCQIKAIKLSGWNRKSWIKSNCCFLCQILKETLIIIKMDQTWPHFDFIQHYLTLCNFENGIRLVKKQIGQSDLRRISHYFK